MCFSAACGTVRGSDGAVDNRDAGRRCSGVDDFRRWLEAGVRVRGRTKRPEDTVSSEPADERHLCRWCDRRLADGDLSQPYDAGDRRVAGSAWHSRQRRVRSRAAFQGSVVLVRRPDPRADALANGTRRTPYNRERRLAGHRGAMDIDFLIPEYWRITGPTKDLNPSDRYLIAALSRPAGLLAQMQKALGPYLMANDTSLQGDEVKTRFAIDILHRRGPAFMTIHLSSLDDAQHGHGPFSAEANQDLEAVDGMLAELAAAAHAGNPAAVVAVVSDHGFTALTHRVNLLIPFLRAGLVTTTLDSVTQVPKLASWKAQPWVASGMAAIMLHDPVDRGTERAVGELLQSLATDPNNGIARIDGRVEIERHGAFPDAAFLVIMKPGFYAAASLNGELVSELPAGHGGHGFSPEFPEMNAAFFIAGAGIARGRDLGAIDMRQIAPTLAQILGVSPSTGMGAPLNVRQ